ncbi:MAG: hypothetical protein K8T25_15780 [Planctomycetia bacterium]|nr:hypothetical protein [Planctomycetia bacterium]
MRLLPPATIPGPALVVSVDLSQALASESRRGSAENVATRLCKLFDGYNVPVTWGLECSPAAAELAESLTHSQNHGIALRYDAKAAVAGSPEALPRLLTLSRELRTHGQVVTSVLVRGELSHVDLSGLARRGINLVVNSGAAEAPSGPLVRTLRFGVWRLGVSCHVPNQGGWLRNSLGGMNARRGIDRAIAGGTLFHLGVDAAGFAAGRDALGSLERILRHADRRRQEGSLRLLTLAEMADQLAVAPSSSACSILRARAA